jgi:RNA polymerase sigma-70 factor (ECF subfamily)
MNTTSPTLLERLRRPEERAAWDRFVQLYTPLLCRCARQLGAQESDAHDLVQDVFATLVQKLPEFHHDRDRSFRGWLRAVVRNRWLENRRRRLPVPLDAQAGPLAEVPGPEDSDAFGETEYRRELVRRALELIEGDFQPATWRAWREFVVAGRRAADVARELGISAHAVYLAKSRVLRRLREELDGLLD